MQLAPVLGALAQNVDPSNVPLSEEEENRIAWLGVLLQPMDRELARLNKVSHLTQDGQTGAIVSYVYPDSPADKAGVKAGWILLRLHVEDFPKPLEIKMENDRSGDWEFPWERLDELPEEYYDRIPAPWPPAENSFTRMITDIGFSKKYRAEFVADGQTVFKDFEVVQSPPHFGAAPKFKSDALGITVRDMTYEVRRYLQKEPNDPGIVISKVEPGSKASVAGIKPYETITHVNEQPVANVKDFERLIAGQQELRLAVKRMVQGRVVKITLTGGPEKPREPEKAAPAEQPAPEAPPADK
jgi:serine protease Do